MLLSNKHLRGFIITIYNNRINNLRIPNSHVTRYLCYPDKFNINYLLSYLDNLCTLP
jgi:hypothetical protein